MDSSKKKEKTDLARLKKGSKKAEQKQPKGPRLSPKARFRAVVHAVLANLYWLQDVDEKEIGESVQANVLMMKSKGKKSVLTLQEKAILMKRAEDRTEEEKRQLGYIVKGIKCFRRYPEDVRMKLMFSTYFVYLPANRVVVRQGHEPQALYFILSGEVIISTTSFNPASNDMVSTNVGIMVPGKMFGEVALLHNILRTATVTTATKCELLMLMKEDFASILQESLQQQWNVCMASMKRFQYFDGWSEVLIRECCILSRVVNYAANETIVGDGAGKRTYVHFILRGQCQLVQNLLVASKNVGGRWQYRLYKEGSPLHRGETVKLHFMQICLYNELECFGLGEEMTDRRVVAMSPVECLLCPLYWILENNKANIWTRIRRFLNCNIPNQEQIFRQFVANRQWLEHKSQLVQKALGK